MKKAILLLPIILICLAQAVAGNSNIIAGNAQTGVKPYWGASEQFAPKVELPPPTGETSEPNPRTILQGGDNFGDALIIPSLPFNDDGTTSGYTDDFTAPCGGTFGGPDVFYSYTPPVDQIINIHLCGTSFYAILYVFQNDSTNLVGCSSFSTVCPGPPSGSLDLLPVTAGNTYYIVVDGYYTSQGPYSIQISEPPHVTCPAAGIPEGEPACGDYYVDTYNSGCNSDNPLFTPISVEDTICGQTGTFLGDGGRYRDTDWFTTTISETQVLTWGAVAECPIQIMMFYAADCSQLIDLNVKFGNAGDTISISANCVAGTYYLFISPQNFDPIFACPMNYVAWLNSSPSPEAPPNDNCADVEPVQLTPGAPIVFTGDNTGATMDCVNLGMPESWVAFTLDVRANVTLDYCGTTPAFGTAFIVLEDQCPCSDYIIFSMYTQYICADHNFTIRWDSLPPGTYYYPVMSKWGVASGPYTINVAAQGAPEMNVTPDQINGEVTVGNSISVPLTIENTGTDQLNYSLVTSQSSDRILSYRPFNRDEFYYVGAQRPPERIKTPSLLGNIKGETPVYNRILQGGEDINSAYPIDALPFYDTGNTDGAIDDYTGNCGGEGGLDVVYSFSPPYEMSITISLCGSGFDTKLYVMENTAENTIACNDDYCGPASQLDNIQVSSSNVYYIVVDGYASGRSGDYVINVTEVVPCVVTCPPGSATEAEPCGQDLNGGCNATPNAFEAIAANSTVCGTGWSDPSLRDTDWYLFSPAEPTYLSLTGTAEFPLLMMLLDASYGCPEGQIPPEQLLWGMTVPPCTTAAASVTLRPGNYWIFVAPYGYPSFPNIPCDGSSDFGNDYVITTYTEPAWLLVDSNSGSIPLFGAPAVINVTLDATHLTPGTYQGNILVSSNAMTNPTVNVPVSLTVNPAGGCSYTIGDANGNDVFNGLDVTYSVSYFKGGPPPPYSCLCDGSVWYVSGDVNQSCSFNGLDVTYMVAYFKGGPGPHPCAACPPLRTLLGGDKVIPTEIPSNKNGGINAN